MRQFEEELREVAALAWTEEARGYQLRIARMLERNGHEVKTEVAGVPYWTRQGKLRQGRLDIFVGDEPAVIEVDRCSPRHKSIQKLRAFSCPRYLILRENDGKPLPDLSDITVIRPSNALRRIA